MSSVLSLRRKLNLNVLRTGLHFPRPHGQHDTFFMPDELKTETLPVKLLSPIHCHIKYNPKGYKSRTISKEYL